MAIGYRLPRPVFVPNIQNYGNVYPKQTRKFAEVADSKLDSNRKLRSTLLITCFNNIHANSKNWTVREKGMYLHLVPTCVV